MPPGCLSPASQLELWAQGERRLGLTPHQCRHAVATLMLALEPGNFARVAAVLGDTEDTVRRHYGKDSGEAAAAAVRAALQARHPDIWKKLKRTQCPE
jgi:integrase